MSNSGDRMDWQRLTTGRGTPRRAEDFLEGRVNWYRVFQWKEKAPVKEERSETVGSFRRKTGLLIDPQLVELIVTFLLILLLVGFTLIWFYCMFRMIRLVGQSPFVLLVAAVFVLGWCRGFYCLCCWADSRSR